jgi:hypothetical protein
MAPELRCEECGSRIRSFEPGWQIVRAGDPETNSVILACYCPVCAPRVLDRLPQDHELIAGGVHGRGLQPMEFTIEFGAQDVEVVITTGGAAYADGFLRLNRALAADPRFRPGMPVLVDHSLLDMSMLTDDDVEEIARSVAAIQDRLGGSRVAIVVPDDLGYHRTAQTRAEAQPLQIEAEIFYSRDEAVAWVRPQTDVTDP